MPFLHRGIGVQNVGSTPPIAAAIRGDAEQIETLLREGAEPNEQDQYGWTALQVAAAYGQGKVVDTLLAKGADPNVTNYQGRSALMYAAAFGHYPIAKALLDHGADVNAKSSDPDIIAHGGPEASHSGETALMLAAWSGWVAIVGLLLKCGADVNVVGGPLGGTAVHSALWEGHKDAIAALLQAPNINLKLRNSGGKTARQVAIEEGRAEIAQLLEEAEARILAR